MRHGNPVVGRNGQGGGDAGNYLKWDLMLCKQLQFLSAAAKQEGVSPLQADYPVSLLRLLQKQLVHLPLRHGMV